MIAEPALLNTTHLYLINYFNRLDDAGTPGYQVIQVILRVQLAAVAALP